MGLTNSVFAPWSRASNAKVHLLTSIPGRQETRLVGSAHLMTFDELMAHLGSLWGISNIDNYVLECTGELLKYQKVVLIGSAVEWTFVASELSRIAASRSSASRRRRYKDLTTDICNKCRHRSSAKRSCQNCGHSDQTNVIEPFNVKILQKSPKPSKAELMNERETAVVVDFLQAACRNHCRELVTLEGTLDAHSDLIMALSKAYTCETGKVFSFTGDHEHEASTFSQQSSPTVAASAEYAKGFELARYFKGAPKEA